MSYFGCKRHRDWIKIIPYLSQNWSENKQSMVILIDKAR